MDSDVCGRSFFSRTLKGFAIAEVLIAIGLVGIAALIVGGLGQQVLNLAKSSKQTAASIELRTKTNSISRNLDSWLGKMRSSLETNGLYAACIPDPSSATSLFKCPAVDAALLDSDSELKRIAGNQLHAVSAPVIDLLGERIAGTIEDPLYLDLDGRKCQQTNQLNCPLKSTGFFLRSNPALDSTPGSVRFVVKVEANRSSQMNKGVAPQRTQYLSIDVGSEWQEVVGTCPAGSIKIGYLASGSPNCVHPTKKCAAGTVALGLDNSANPICATPPAACVSGGAIVDTASNTLVCSSASPCSSNQIFLGYYSGTGTPMCSDTNMSCPAGQVQVGIQGAAGSLTALCKSLPSCQESQKLSYDGSQFVCQSATVASNCKDGEVVVGINTDGSAKCQSAERNLASTDLDCPHGKYVSGLESDGSVKCKDLPNSSPSGSGIIYKDDLVLGNEKSFTISQAGTLIATATHTSNASSQAVVIGVNGQRCAADSYTGGSISSNTNATCILHLAAGTHRILVDAQNSGGSTTVGINYGRFVVISDAAPSSPNVNDLRPLMIKSITPDSATAFNNAISSSLNRLYNGNTSASQPIMDACRIANTGLSVVGSKGYFGELSYCLLHVCSGMNGEYPTMAQLRGGCGSLNTDQYCNGQFSMSISCMY